MPIKPKALKKRKPHSPDTCARQSLQAYINFGKQLEHRDITRVAKKCGLGESRVRALWDALSEGAPVVGTDSISQGIKTSIPARFTFADFFHLIGLP